MGMGEAIFVSLVVILMFAGAYMHAKGRRGRGPTSSPPPDDASRQMQEDIGRMRQIAEYDRWSINKDKK
jgi:hypothetical protein